MSKKKPTVSEINPGKINRIAAKAIDAPESTS